MGQLETKAEYLSYIFSQLSSLNRGLVKASYDTGYGLHLVNTYLGDECHCMDVITHSVLKIRTPKMQGESWDSAWESARLLVNEYIKENSQA
jgi:hypothetical protein